VDKAGKPIILVDTREQRPLYFGEASPTRRATLPTGDYSVEGLEGLIAVERKSLGDLFGTVGKGRERFEREIIRASHLRYFGIMVEATFDQVLAGAPHSQMNSVAVIASLHCWELRYPCVHVHYVGSSLFDRKAREKESRRNAAALTRKLLYKMAEYVSLGEIPNEAGGAGGKVARC